MGTSFPPITREGLRALSPFFLVLAWTGILVAAFFLPGKIESDLKDVAQGARKARIEAAAMEDQARSLKEWATRLSGRIEYRRGIASHYADFFQGRRTASGKIFDQGARILAHKSEKFGTPVFVVYGGKMTFGTVQDRGPFIPGRSWDLSRGMAGEIGLTRPGTAEVEIYILKGDQ